MRIPFAFALYALVLLGPLGCKRYVDMEDLAKPVGGAAAPRSTAGAPEIGSNSRSSLSAGAGGAGGAAGRSEPVMASKPADVTGKTDGYGWTELRGGKIGTGEATAAELRKPLSLKLIGDAGYMAMRGFALRSSPSSQYISAIVEVTNSGKQLQCFIKAEQLKLKTKTGELIPAQREREFVSGSLAVSSVVTNTCLAAGETGYLSASPTSSSGPDTFSALTEIEFALTASPTKFERPDFKLVPKSYRAKADRLQLELVNEGTAKAPIEDITLVQYVLLDAEGLPLDIGYLEASTTATSVPPGGTLTADDTYYFTGASERMKVLASY